MGYFIRKRKKGWTLTKTYYENGRCFAPTIPISEYSQHLFSESMTVEEARENAKRLNRELLSSVEISVTDNGKGIDPEIISRLGQLGATRGKAQGSGLGLFHAKMSAER